MFFGLIGARLIHILYEEPSYYSERPMAAFEFWNGGFVFYGGFLGAVAGGYIFLKLKKVASIAQVFDLAAPVASFGYGFGRLACLWAGCCYGKDCELPWAIQGRHPTQLYSTLWELGVWMILIGIEPKVKRPGQFFAIWLALHSVGRFLIEFYRDDFRGPVAIFSISGWISLALLMASLTFLLGPPQAKEGR